MSALRESALHPKSMAVIGASGNIHEIGGRPIHYRQKHGFAGRIYPIDPAHDEVQGIESDASLAALPEAPELALVIVGGDKAVAAVDDCAARGVKSAVVIASGFGEAGAQGREAQKAMADRARAAGKTARPCPRFRCRRAAHRARAQCADAGRGYVRRISWRVPRRVR
ncbi:CoA-binding protein [Verminephrobacter eiseniae]|uniref:CoA-binding protein n=1 Tax=Verminephrobacter eiseniae TaxID=364317 RepID=UPI0022370CF9|nr:CoA-binding protein [Verminephrobacter eiseniae]MCW5237106.1 hypothetical protein [Verminephrobacter eiseniae]